MSVGQATPRSLDEVLADYKRRLISLERRLPAPPRSALGPAGTRVTNWNDAVNTGFYWSDANALNRPTLTWASGYVLRNAMPGFERIVQVTYLPGTDERSRTQWVRVGYWSSGTLLFSAWRRSDFIMSPSSGTNYTWDRGTGRLDLTPGTKTWSVNGVFTGGFRAYQILFQWYTGDLNGASFRLRQGVNDETAADYQSQTIYITGSGTPAGSQQKSNNGNFPAQPGFGFSGEIIVTEPMYTAGNNNQKRIRGHWNHYNSQGGGGTGMTLCDASLVNHDNFAYDGFTISLSDTSAGKNGITAGSAAWIVVKGIA